MKINKAIHRVLGALVLAMVGITSCEDDAVGPSGIVPEFEFVVENPLKVTFTNMSEKATHYRWNFGDGKSSAEASPVHVYQAGGTYTVTLSARSGRGSKVVTHTVTVEGEETVDLIVGGDMSSPADWNLYSMGATLTTAEFVDGALKFSNGAGPAQTNIALWQAVEVEEGVEYKFSAQVKGSGATNSWAELYFGKTAPTDGSDYSEGIYTGINTWDGCGTGPFEGNFSDISCKAPANGQGGVMSFAESGTIYLVLKVGSWDGSWGTAGITFDNISLIEL